MSIKTLIEISEKAIEVYELKKACWLARLDLRDAYKEWKTEHGYDYIDKKSDEYKEMTDDTKPVINKLWNLGKLEQLAQKRLEALIAIHQSMSESDADQDFPISIDSCDSIYEHTEGEFSILYDSESNTIIARSHPDDPGKGHLTLGIPIGPLGMIGAGQKMIALGAARIE